MFIARYEDFEYPSGQNVRRPAQPGHNNRYTTAYSHIDVLTWRWVCAVYSRIIGLMSSEKYQCHFIDISQDDLVSASQLIDGYVPVDLRNDCSVTNDELIATSQAYDISVGDYTGLQRFRLVQPLARYVVNHAVF